MIAVIVIGVGCAYLGNELCEFSPWCARKLVRWSASRRYADPGRAEMRAEELAAVIDARPGNLLKLITAAVFVGAAVIVCARRAVARESREPEAGAGTLPASGPMSHAEVLSRLFEYLDVGLDDLDSAKIRWHLDECGDCLREYGLEEAVRRLVQRECGAGPESLVLRSNALVRIRGVRSDVERGE